MTTVYDFTVRGIDGQEVSLADFRGKVLLIVNTASRCGFTPQYEGLEALYRELHDRGLVVLGFPCNQFGAQEPANEAEIADFCKRTYDVSFPMFAKVEVNGPDASPLFVWLKDEAPSEPPAAPIKWNFAKFLLDRQGNVVDRFASAVTPDMLRPDIEGLL